MKLTLKQGTTQYTFKKFQVEGGLNKDIVIRKAGRSYVPRCQDHLRCEFRIKIIGWMKKNGSQDEWEQLWEFQNWMQQTGGVFQLLWGDDPQNPVHTRNVTCDKFNWWHMKKNIIKFNLTLIETQT